MEDALSFRYGYMTMTWIYVEDLHTVNNGVITDPFPLLTIASRWDFFVGCLFLGVDYVGHCFGPDLVLTLQCSQDRSR